MSHSNIALHDVFHMTQTSSIVCLSYPYSSCCLCCVSFPVAVDSSCTPCKAGTFYSLTGVLTESFVVFASDIVREARRAGSRRSQAFRRDEIDIRLVNLIFVYGTFLLYLIPSFCSFGLNYIRRICTTATGKFPRN